MSLAGKHIVVTAGGTREPIDPVRYIGNRSSGKMGFALAEAARDRGAKVTLITAPVSLTYPSGVEIIDVESVNDMKKAVVSATAEADALIMAAAPADYVAKSIAPQKIKKGKESLTIEFIRAPDIISEVAGDFIKVGFSAETENLLENARQKLTNKNLDLIVANDVTAADSGFGADTNKVFIIDKNGNIEDLPLMGKREVAEKILDRVVELLPAKEELMTRKRLLDRIETMLWPKSSRRNRATFINIPKDKTYLFPDYEASFTIMTDKGEFKTHLVAAHKGGKDHFHLPEWFGAHQELKPKDRVIIKIFELENKKEYYLRKLEE